MSENNTTTVKPKAIKLPASSVRRVNSAALYIQKKYDLLNRTVTAADFTRICEGEEIQVMRVGLMHKGFALHAANRPNNWNGKVIVFSKAKRTVSLRSKFYFIGALVIPSMHNAKKLIAGEVSELELQTKHAECELFASLILKRL